MVQEKVQAGERLTLPRAVLEEAGVHPGDVAQVEVTGPHQIEITVVSPSHGEDVAQPVEAIATEPRPWSATIGPGDAVDPETLPVWTLEDVLDRFQIEDPIDFEAEREAWHDEAAKDVFGERLEWFTGAEKPRRADFALES